MKIVTKLNMKPMVRMVKILLEIPQMENRYLKN
jgi:hypothetical protein